MTKWSISIYREEAALTGVSCWGESFIFANGWTDSGIQEYWARSIICFFLVAPITWWWQNQGKVIFRCCFCIFFFPISFWATRPKALWGIWCQLGNSQGNCCCNMQKIWPLVYTPRPTHAFTYFFKPNLSHFKQLHTAQLIG